MRVVSLGSGSSGNAFLVEAGPQGRTRLLLDAGLSARTIIARLASVGVLPVQLQGILVTHEHRDHVQAIPQLVKQYALPVMAASQTLAALEEGVRTGFWRSDAGKLVPARTADASSPVSLSPVPQPSSQLVFTAETLLASTPDELALLARTSFATGVDSAVITTDHAPALPSLKLSVGGKVQVGDIEVSAFAISHDAVAPCGYLLQAGGCRLCLITDSGEVTATMLEYIQQADLLILESNHDRERLLRGPYPWSLKRRILSPTGHLSNEQAAQAVLNTWRENGLRWLWLAHLSRTNNTPGLALESMQAYLRGAHVNLAHIRIAALPPTLGPVWDSTQLWQLH
jgi:Metal-dependent hydrolases of the beta-lactamase superfamily I